MTIDKSELVKACSRIFPLTQKRSTLPVLNCFRLRAEDHRLMVGGSDLDCFQEVSMECIGSLVPCCVNAKIFSRLINTAGESVRLELADKVLKIDSGWKSELCIIPGEEFTAFPTDELDHVDVNCTELSEAMSAVEWCAFTPDEAFKRQRPMEASILLDLSKKEFNVAAITGQRMCWCQRDDLESSKFKGLIPIQYSPLIAKALTESGADVFANENIFRVLYGDGVIACKLVDSEIVDYKRFRDFETSPICAFLKREELLEHLLNCESVNPLSTDVIGGGIADFQFGKDAVRINSASRSGSRYEAEMNQSHADGLTVKFSTAAVIKALRACPDESIEWKQKDAMSPLIIRYGNYMTILMGLLT